MKVDGTDLILDREEVEALMDGQTVAMTRLPENTIDANYIKMECNHKPGEEADLIRYDGSIVVAADCEKCGERISASVGDFTHVTNLS